MERQVEIELPGRLDLTAAMAENGMSGWDIGDFSVGNDGCIHLLAKETTPPRIDNMFVPTTSDTNYRALSFLVDWETGEIQNREMTDFGRLGPNLHFIQRLGEGFLLLGARARFTNGEGEKNALITGPDGRIQARHCFGDGIQQCLVDGQNRIITSYFDEGVFGNYGWDNPVGFCGLVLWSADGEPVWRNEAHDICDCYAMNLDRQDQLWFYYYMEFQLVKTNYEKDTAWDTGVSGSNGFLIHPWGRAVLFDAGYKKHGAFLVKELQPGRLSNGTPAQFVHGGQPIASSWFAFRDSQALLRTDDGTLYFGDWSFDPVLELIRKE